MINNAHELLDIKKINISPGLFIFIKIILNLQVFKCSSDEGSHVKQNASEENSILLQQIA